VRLALLIVGTLTVATGAAEAHPAPFSYLDLHIRDAVVEGLVTLHVIDVAHELGMANASDLLDAAVVQRERHRVIALVSSRLAIRSGGEPLALEWDRLQQMADRDALRLQFRATAASGGSIAVRARLFQYDPLHQTFLNVYEDGSLRQQMVFNAADDERTYYRGTVKGTLAVVGTFVPSGVRHILIGPDHILFLVGLLLLGGGGWALVRIVTAFTIGHSITLTLAALEVMSPPATVVEPAIALSIVFVGADNLLVGTRGRDVRAWIALVFGLVHGFGFAYVLKDFGLPREALAWSLFSFNVGVEIGQLMIVLAIAGMLALVRRRNQAAERSVAFAGSVVVMAAGAYWFVERVFFAGGV
jgi:hydrogenase/urease accessory protein HupE